MGAFDDDAFAATAFADTAFSLDSSPPPPPTPSTGTTKRHRVMAAVLRATFNN